MKYRFSIAALGLFLGFMTEPSSAAYIFNVDQNGGNVVATGSGSLNLSGYTSSPILGQEEGSVSPSYPGFSIGDLDTSASVYFVNGSGPSSFGPGPGAATFATSGSVFSFYVETGIIALVTPLNYTSGSEIGKSTETFTNATFASIGLTPGQYVYTIGPASDGPGNTITVDVGKTAVGTVPLPASAPLFGAALMALGAVGFGLKRKRAAAA